MKRLTLNLKNIEADVAISDGYHTFDELYDHRITLYIALCRELHKDVLHRNVWRSRVHSDGSNYDGWFILGIFTEKGNQISYHIPDERWSETDFLEGDATKKVAPEFDGHTSTDVLERIKRL